MIFFAGLASLLLAAITAAAVARRDPAHLPLAIYFAAWSASSVVRRALAVLVFDPWRELYGAAPLAGWARVAGHLETALYLAGVFGVTGFAWWTFAKRNGPDVSTEPDAGRGPRTLEEVPAVTPAGTRRVSISRVADYRLPGPSGGISPSPEPTAAKLRRTIGTIAPALAAWGVFLASCVLNYPSLRGEALASVYRAATVVAVLLALGAVVVSRSAPGLERRKRAGSASEDAPGRPRFSASASMSGRTETPSPCWAYFQTMGIKSDHGHKTRPNSGSVPLLTLILTAGLAATIPGPFLTANPYRSWALAQTTWTLTLLCIAVLQGRSLWLRFRLTVT